MRKIVIFLCTIFLLAACNTRELEFDRVYPDNAKLEAYRAQLEEERLDSDEYKKYKVLLESNYEPAPLIVRSDHTDLEKNLKVIKYCWEEKIEACEHLNEDSILEDPSLYLESFTYETYRDLWVSVTNNPDLMPDPSGVMISIYDENNEYIPAEPFFGIDSKTYYYKETRPGTYTYIFKVAFEGVIGGIALYAAKVTVVK